MTSYFDDKVRDIHTYAEEACGDFGKVRDEVAAIELETIKEVVLVTGDREFPDDLREKIMGIIATQAVCEYILPPTRKALEYLKATHESVLLESLHSAFHELGRRRIQTRFGLLSDHPRSILVLREEWEEEHYRFLRGE